jgi:hypothetical protein
VCSPSIPKPVPPPPPPPAPVKMTESMTPTAATRSKRRKGGFGLDLLTIPMGEAGGTGAQIPGT